MGAAFAQDGPLEAKCKACIAAATAHLILDQGQVKLPVNKGIRMLLKETYVEILDIFSLRDPQLVLPLPESLRKILHAAFDTSTRSFVLAEDAENLLVRLKEPCSVIIFAQAIAGIVILLRRIEEVLAATDHPSSSTAGLNPGIFARELQLFAESDARRRTIDILDREGSLLFGACSMRSQVDALVWKAIEDRDSGVVELPMASIGEELLHKGVAWVSDRPCRNMGLPWGFTILALNE